MKYIPVQTKHARKTTNLLIPLIIASWAMFLFWHSANKNIELQHIGAVPYTNGWATLANVMVLGSTACVLILTLFIALGLTNRKHASRLTTISFLNNTILITLIAISIVLLLMGVLATNKAKDDAGKCATYTAINSSYYSWTNNCSKN
jgi:uncharacterized membrane protein YidH (DUF202 family)